MISIAAIITYVLLVLLIILNIILAVAMSRRFKAANEQIKAEFQQVRKEFRVMISGVTGMGKHLVEVEKQFGDLADKQSEMVELTQQDNTHSAYAQAKKMLEMGADIAEIIDVCGLTKAEAELLSNLNVSYPSASQAETLETIRAGEQFKK